MLTRTLALLAALVLPASAAYVPRLCTLSAAAVGIPGFYYIGSAINPDTGGTLTQFCMREVVLRSRYIGAAEVLRAAARTTCSGLAAATSLLAQANLVTVEKVSERLAGSPPKSWFFRPDNYNRAWTLSALRRLCPCLAKRADLWTGDVAQTCGFTPYVPKTILADDRQRLLQEGLLTTAPVECLTAAQQALVDAVHAEHRQLGADIQEAIRAAGAQHGSNLALPFTGAALADVQGRVGALAMASHLGAHRDDLARTAVSERQEILLTIPRHPTSIDWRRPPSQILHLFDVADACHAAWASAVKRCDPFHAWLAGHVCHEQTHDQLATYAKGLIYRAPCGDNVEACPNVSTF